MRTTRPRAFTLVEILIVVVILGILAAIIVPQFASATEQASRAATLDQLNRVRRAVMIYYYDNASRYPDVENGDGTWGGLIAAGSQYLRDPPRNLYIDSDNGRLVTLADEPDTAYQAAYGWIFKADTGDIWAAAYDGDDRPYPRP